MTEIVVNEEQERPGGPVEVDEELVENTSALIEAGDRGSVLNLVIDMYPADLARLLTHLAIDEARTLFRWLPADEASEVLPELDDAFQRALLEDASPVRLTAILDHLDTDDAADVLAELPEETTLRVLPHLEDAEAVRNLLLYEEDTAGGIMAVEFVAVPGRWTVGETTEEIRRHAETVEDLYAVFVMDEAHRLVGVTPLKDLLLSPNEATMEEVMSTDVISVTPEMDQEDVARIMERYDLVSLPVVNAEGRLLGRITIDDVVDVIREEAEEDIQKMSGVSGDEEPSDSAIRISRGRLPWLLIGMVGAGLAGVVIGSFEESLQAVPILAAFIPVVMAMAGNAGIQSSGIIVQGLASGDVWTSDVLRRLSKEVTVALINGVVLALVLGLAVLVMARYVPLFDVEGPVRLASTAALSLLLVIILATCIGTTVPLLLHRFGIDPALATGPFITTSNDIFGLIVFFALATLIYL